MLKSTNICLSPLYMLGKWKVKLPGLPHVDYPSAEAVHSHLRYVSRPLPPLLLLHSFTTPST